MRPNIHSIHFVGIKGVGMASLALIAKQAGITVTGSDVSEAFITDELLSSHGISVLEGFEKEHVSTVDLVITTGAHGGFENVEVIQAKELGIPVLTQGEAVGKFMDGELFVEKKPVGISVAGSHGKTTTTAMIATMLASSGLDPSYVIGTSLIPSLEGPGHLGKGKYLVVEADEYATEPKTNKKAKLLWHSPQVIVLTNADFDHPDIYESLDDVLKVFETFITKLPDNGFVIACGDDENVKGLVQRTNKHVITYGYSPQNTYHISRTSIEEGQMFFSVEKRGVYVGDFMLNVAGKHNCLNALSAICLGMELGLPLQLIAQGISAYKGAKRRMELLGRLESGALVYDDYAHHPKEIHETLRAFRNMFPQKQITVIFQPHTYSRTKKLYDQFVRSFDDADRVGVMDIFASMRELRDNSVSSQTMVDVIKQRKHDVSYLPHVPDVLKYIDQNRLGHTDILIFMGAGDIYKIAEELSFEK